jgi:hypothetical protein
MRKTILTAFLLTCGIAQASPEWATVSITNNGKLIAYVDLGSIRIEDGNVRSALFKFHYAPHTDKDARTNKWHKEAYSQETFNCGNETSRVDSLRFRFDDGTEWSESKVPTEWTPIGPDTLRDWQRKFVCKGNK